MEVISKLRINMEGKKKTIKIYNVYFNIFTARNEPLTTRKLTTKKYIVAKHNITSIISGLSEKYSCIENDRIKAIETVINKDAMRKMIIPLA
jgi:hypothetical protein